MQRPGRVDPKVPVRRLLNRPRRPGLVQIFRPPTHSSARAAKALNRSLGNTRAGQLMTAPLQRQERQERLEQEEPLQRQEGLEEDELQMRLAPGTLERQIPENVSENRTGMPDHLKADLEHPSDYGLSGLRVHRNSPKPAQLNALAFAQGRDIHLPPGQKKHLPHESWHAVQQMRRAAPIAIGDKEHSNHHFTHTSPSDLQADIEASRPNQRVVSESSGGGRLRSPETKVETPIQMVSMLVQVGIIEDRENLREGVALEEQAAGLEAENLEDADLGDLGAGDVLTLTGAHGNSNSIGPYDNGGDLAQALLDRGLRQCLGIVITGCHNGQGLHEQLMLALPEGVVKGYITAPLTWGTIRDDGRTVAYTPEAESEVKTVEQLADLEKFLGKDDAPDRREIEDIQDQSANFIENPVQILEEMNEEMDQLDRYVDDQNSGMTYYQYIKQFYDLKIGRAPLFDRAKRSWALLGTESFRERLVEIIQRKPRQPRNQEERAYELQYATGN